MFYGHCLIRRLNRRQYSGDVNDVLLSQMQNGDRKKKRRCGFRHSSRKQLAKSRMARRQVQSSSIDLTSTIKTLLYDSALPEEVVVETHPLEGEISRFAVSRDNQPFMSECELEEDLSSEKQIKVSVYWLKNIFDVLQNNVVCCGSFFKF